jgi:hypothetical protein
VPSHGNVEGGNGSVRESSNEVKPMGLWDTLKDAVKVLQRAGKIDELKAILELQQTAIDLRRDNEQLRQEIASLKDQAALATRLEFRGNAYWLKKTDGHVDGPFCSRCWDSDKRLVRLHDLGNGYSRCPEKTCDMNPVSQKRFSAGLG